MLLDSQLHHSLRVILKPSLTLPQASSTVPLVLDDVASMSQTYPILLDAHPLGIPVACLGKHPYPNGYTAPILTRCEPFMVAPINTSSISEKARYIQIKPGWGIHLDLLDPRVGESSGYPVIESDGQLSGIFCLYTPTLEQQAHKLEKMMPYLSVLDELKVLRRVRIKVQGETYIGKVVDHAHFTQCLPLLDEHPYGLGVVALGTYVLDSLRHCDAIEWLDKHGEEFMQEPSGCASKDSPIKDVLLDLLWGSIKRIFKR